MGGMPKADCAALITGSTEQLYIFNGHFLYLRHGWSDRVEIAGLYEIHLRGMEGRGWDGARKRATSYVNCPSDRIAASNIVHVVRIRTLSLPYDHIKDLNSLIGSSLAASSTYEVPKTKHDGCCFPISRENSKFSTATVLQ